MLVDLVIPARDEAASLPRLLDALPRDRLRHVVVVDNGSSDDTALRARAGDAVVLHESQRGYGAACLKALGWLEQQDPPPEIVAFIDADLSDDPAYLADLCWPVANGEADLAIGSRTAGAEPGALTRTQRFGNALACRLIHRLTGRRYGDLGPMRAIRFDALRSLAMTDRTWGWTVEMQYKASSRGLRTVELPVPYRPRRAGRSKISGSLVGSVRAGWRIIVTILRLWRSERRMPARRLARTR